MSDATGSNQTTQSCGLKLVVAGVATDWDRCEKQECLDAEKCMHPKSTVVPREKRWDVLRNSADLYGSMYHVIATLAVYHLVGAEVDRHIASHLARVASKVLPHLPAPAEEANVW